MLDQVEILYNVYDRLEDDDTFIDEILFQNLEANEYDQITASIKSIMNFEHYDVDLEENSNKDYREYFLKEVMRRMLEIPF